MKIICTTIIRLYQYTIAPLLGNCCRFYPTCSEYSKEAIQKFGARKGLKLTFKRIIKCHPRHPGGYDPLP